MFEIILWRVMIWTAHRWASHHMDQWDKVKFNTKYGTVFFGLTRHDPYPDSYYSVDRFGRPSSAAENK